MVAGVGMGVLYYRFNPGDVSVFPRCPFLTLTGWKCPGCGSQRAFHALLHGEWGRAFHYNAFLVLSLPVIALLACAEGVRRRVPRFYVAVQRPLFIWIYFALTLLWWLGRNVAGL